MLIDNRLCIRFPFLGMLRDVHTDSVLGPKLDRTSSMSIPKPVKESVATALGHELRRRRRDIGLTQAELAEKTGVHETYVSQLERGVNVPSIDVVFALCDAMESETGSFLERVKQLAEEYRE